MCKLKVIVVGIGCTLVEFGVKGRGFGGQVQSRKLGKREGKCIQHEDQDQLVLPYEFHRNFHGYFLQLLDIQSV